MNNIVEEVGQEDGFILKEFLLFALVLHVPEMWIFGQVGERVLIETLEGDIAANFVVFGQTVGTLRHYIAVIFNCLDRVEKAILFDEGSSHETFVGVLWGSVF